MLDFRRDQVASLSHIGHSAADYGEIVRFRAAGCEDKVLLVHLQDLRQGLLRLGDLPLSLHAFVVHAGGIAVLFQVYFVHQLHYFRKAPGRSRVVQIRFSHVSSSINTCGTASVLRRSPVCRTLHDNTTFCRLQTVRLRISRFQSGRSARRALPAPLSRS